MEPMTLGSAPSSPSSPTHHPNFLPAFLMGDSTQPGTPNPNNTSPGRNRSAGRKLGQTSTPNLYPKLFNHTVTENSKSTFTPHKPGPPNQGLFDTIDQNRKPISASPVLSATSFNDSPVMFGKSRLNQDSFNYSLMNETTNLSRVDKIDTHWVTVFGFPPSALGLVLAQLNNCGVIVEKKVPTQGNWVHVKFNSLSQVPRALALNGKCINNAIMIGVSLYYSKENKENETMYTTPSRARSLRHSYISPMVSPTNPDSVLPPQNVPQKTTGMMSKAFEYVFGW